MVHPRVNNSGLTTIINSWYILLEQQPTFLRYSQLFFSCHCCQYSLYGNYDILSSVFVYKYNQVKLLENNCITICYLAISISNVPIHILNITERMRCLIHISLFIVYGYTCYYGNHTLPYDWLSRSYLLSST